MPDEDITAHSLFARMSIFLDTIYFPHREERGEHLLEKAHEKLLKKDNPSETCTRFGEFVHQ